MLTISLDKSIKTLIIIGLCITPFLNYGEVLALMRGELESQVMLYTPIYIKLLKDIIMIFLILLLFLKNFKGTSIPVILATLFFITIVSINIFTSTIAGYDSYIIYGLRWSYPLMIIFLGYKIIDKKHFDMKFDFFLGLILSLHFLLQIFQLFSGITWFGVIEGYSVRNSGIFLLPNTAAFFSVIVLYWFMYEFNGNRFIKISFILLCIISIFLTGSGTGVVVASILVLIYLIPKKCMLLGFPILSMASIPGLFLVSYFRGEYYIEVSGGTRLQNFKDVLSDVGLFSQNFGYYTNVAILMDKGDMIVDSTFGSILGNLGLIVFIVVVVFLLYLAFKAYLQLNKTKLSFVTIVSLFSLTTIILEAYPMNLLLSLIGCKLYNNTNESYRGINEHSS